MTSPPSQAVIEAVEQAEMDHDPSALDALSGIYLCPMPCGHLSSGAQEADRHVRIEVAKAAMDAARPIILREAADAYAADPGVSEHQSRGTTAAWLRRRAEREAGKH